MKELKDYFPNGYDGNGIFTAISSISWFGGVSPAALDTYFMLTNGEKLASKICELFADSDGHITGDKLKNLARIIHGANIEAWKRSYDALMAEYNPIENTDYVETYKGSAEGSSGGSTAEAGKTKTTGDRYGFNSSSAVPDSVNTTDFAPDGEGSGHITTVTATSQGADEHEIRKHGNIGVTTNAAMVTEELRLRNENKFFDILCSDVCKMIALSIF
jgi:hypothetical protein